MSKAANKSTRLPHLVEPLAAVAAVFVSGNTSADSFRLQLIASVIGLSDEDLKALAQKIVAECR